MALLVTQLTGFASGGGGVPVTLINRGAFVSDDSVDATTATFSAYAIGTASSTRRVIVYVAAIDDSKSSVTFTSATIGGVSATIDCQVDDSSPYNTISAIISATVPTGTTADIVLNFDTSVDRAAVVAVSVDGLQSVTPVDTLTDTARTLTGTIDWQTDGFVIGGSLNSNVSDTCSWTGLTERADENLGSDDSISFADLFPTSSSNGATVTAQWGLTDRQSMAVASYR
jgi:hypothetical protein